MLYRFAKIMMTAGLRFFYRHIYTTGLENIPSGGPAIIIANHPSALMDAILLGVVVKRPLYFFTRGDVFVNRFVERILSWLHMLPVHSHNGNRDSRDINTSSFSEAVDILARGGIIVFFPESTSHTEREIYPFRKGVFRLAFLAAETHQFRFEIPLIPVGIGYDHITAARACVQVHAAKPITVTAFRMAYETSPSACLLHISRGAWETMTENALHLTRKERFGTAEALLLMARNDHTPSKKSWKIESRRQLQNEISICGKINRMEEDEFKDLGQGMNHYSQMLLQQHGLEDKTLSPTFSCPVWKRILVWNGFILFIAGMVLNGLPIWIARQIADKKVYRPDFYSAVFASCSSVLYLLWLITVCTGAMLFLGGAFALFAAAVMILTGLFSYYYIDWKKTCRQYRLRSRVEKNQLAVLLQLRRDITKH